MGNLISIVIPVYNSEKYIRRCLDSVCSQTYKNIEVIIVDDVSKDESVNIVKEYTGKLTMKIITHLENKGQMYARYTGYTSCSGEFVMFLDSDDSLKRDAVEKLYDAAKKNNSDLVSGDIEYIGVDGNVSVWKSKLSYGNNRDGLLLSMLKDEYRHNLVAKLYKSSLLVDYKYKTFANSRRFEDYCLLYQIAGNVKTPVCIDSPVYEYYQNIKSSSQADFSDEAIESMFLAHKVVFDIYKTESKFYNAICSQNQRFIARMLLRGYNRNGIVNKMINKYDFKELLTIKSIIQMNSLIDSVKILISILIGLHK